MTAPMIHRPGMIAVLLSISLAGISACGPAAPDYSPSLESRASLGMPSKSQSITQHPWAPSNGLSTPAASPVTSAASNYTQATAQEKPAPLLENLSLPVWIAQALDAPETSVRIQALDMWAQQGAQAPLDPLVVALDDENDEVRIKAMEIIERNWAIDQKAEAEK
ncbi:MAG: HEAT repeat domain-containing protein [Nitrospira sp.]